MPSKYARASKQAEIVVWIDSCEPGKGAWDAPTHPNYLHPCIVFTVGFVVSENARIVQVARDMTEHGAAGAFVDIIRSNIISRKRIAVPRVLRSAADK